MIQFNCPHCGAKLKVPDSAGGKTGACPKCSKAVKIPDQLWEAELLPEPVPSPRDVYGLDDEIPKASVPAAADDGRRPCPMCGEMIVESAAKCRYCGEVFDKALKRAKAKKGKRKRSSSPEDADLSGVDWAIAILCSGIGCIVGIVWMIQGKPKGSKMFGISLLFNFAWGGVRYAIETATKQ